MREIKFRAWFEKFKEMYTVNMMNGELLLLNILSLNH